MLKKSFKTKYGIDAIYWRLMNATFNVNIVPDNIGNESPKFIHTIDVNARLAGYATQEAANDVNAIPLDYVSVSIRGDERDKWIVQLLDGAAKSYGACRDTRPSIYAAIKELSEWKDAEDVITEQK